MDVEDADRHDSQGAGEVAEEDNKVLMQTTWPRVFARLTCGIPHWWKDKIAWRTSSQFSRGRMTASWNMIVNGASRNGRAAAIPR